MGNADLPICRSADVVKTLCRDFGWEIAPGRGKGSHIRLKKPGQRPLTIPSHGDLKRGLFAGVLKDAGITNQEFLDRHR